MLGHNLLLSEQRLEKLRHSNSPKPGKFLPFFLPYYVTAPHINIHKEPEHGYEFTGLELEDQHKNQLQSLFALDTAGQKAYDHILANGEINFFRDTVLETEIICDYLNALNEQYPDTKNFGFLYGGAELEHVEALEKVNREIREAEKIINSERYASLEAPEKLKLKAIVERGHLGVNISGGGQAAFIELLLETLKSEKYKKIRSKVRIVGVTVQGIIESETESNNTAYVKKGMEGVCEFLDETDTKGNGNILLGWKGFTENLNAGSLHSDLRYTIGGGKFTVSPEHEKQIQDTVHVIESAYAPSPEELHTLYHGLKKAAPPAHATVQVSKPVADRSSASSNSSLPIPDLGRIPGLDRVPGLNRIRAALTVNTSENEKKGFWPTYRNRILRTMLIAGCIGLGIGAGLGTLVVMGAAGPTMGASLGVLPVLPLTLGGIVGGIGLILGAVGETIHCGIEYALNKKRKASINRQRSITQEDNISVAESLTLTDEFQLQPKSNFTRDEKYSPEKGNLSTHSLLSAKRSTSGKKEGYQPQDKYNPPSPKS